VAGGGVSPLSRGQTFCPSPDTSLPPFHFGAASISAGSQTARKKRDSTQPFSTTHKAWMTPGTQRKTDSTKLMRVVLTLLVLR